MDKCCGTCRFFYRFITPKNERYLHSIQTASCINLQSGFFGKTVMADESLVCEQYQEAKLIREE